MKKKTKKTKVKSKKTKKETGILSPIQDVKLGSLKNVRIGTINHTMKGIPANVQDLISKFAKNLGEITGKKVEVEALDSDNSGDPLDALKRLMGGVIPSKKFIPLDDDKFEIIADDLEDICKNGKDGYAIIGKVKAKHEGSTNVQGLLQVNRMSRSQVLLSVIKNLGLDRNDAIEIIQDNEYQVD